MPSRDLTYNIIGKDQSGSATFGKVANAAESSGKKISDAFGKVGNYLGGELGDIIGKTGDALGKLGEKGGTGFSKMTGAAAGLTGVGLALQSFASGSKAAEAQLKAAVDATGESIGDYSKQIDKANDSMARFAHDDDATANALQILTTATGSLQIALDDLQVVADLAAAKHISLTDAAQSVALIYAGNTRLLKQYGITMQVTAGNTDQARAAVQLLADKLAGQASAASDTFNGKIAEAKTRVIDFAENLAGQLGPAITYVSSGATILSGVLDFLSARKLRAAEASLVEAGATTAAGAAEGRQTITAATLTAATDKLTLAQVRAAVANEGLATGSNAAALAQSRNATTALTATGSMGGLLPILGKVGVAGGVVAGAAMLAEGAIRIFGEGTVKAAPESLELAAALNETAGALDNTTRSAIQKAAADAGLLDQQKYFTINTADLVDGLNGNDEALKRVTDEVRRLSTVSDPLDHSQVKLAASAEQYEGKLQGLLKTIKAQRDAQGNLNRSNSGATGISDNLASSTSKLGVSFKDATVRVMSLDDAMQKLLGSSQSLAEAEDAMHTNLNKLGETVKDSGTKTLEGFTQGAIDNREAIRGQIDKINELAKKQLEAGVATDQVSAAMASNEQQLADTAAQAGLNKDQVKKLIEQYALVPSKITTEVTLNAESALKTMATLSERGNYIIDMFNNGFTKEAVDLSNKYAGYGGQGTSMYTHATGGYLTPGVNKLAEHGMEIVTSDGRVIPTMQTQQLIRDGAGASAGNVININVTVSGIVTGSSTDVGRALAGELEQFVGAGGQINISQGTR